MLIFSILIARVSRHPSNDICDRLDQSVNEKSVISWGFMLGTSAQSQVKIILKSK
jgi:uncharacterized lipoprotein YajG